MSDPKNPSRIHNTYYKISVIYYYTTQFALFCPSNVNKVYTEAEHTHINKYNGCLELIADITIDFKLLMGFSREPISCDCSSDIFFSPSTHPASESARGERGLPDGFLPELQL